MCADGRLADATRAIRLNPNTDVGEYAFYKACRNGHLRVAQWLLRAKPDISANNETAFQYACVNGHLRVAQWLLRVKPDISISTDNEITFRWACSNGHLRVAQWLCSGSSPTLMLARTTNARSCTRALTATCGSPSGCSGSSQTLMLARTMN